MAEANNEADYAPPNAANPHTPPAHEDIDPLTTVTPNNISSKSSSTTEAEDDDEFMSHPAIKKMRDYTAAESFQFLRQQRISCMLDGAWFQIPTVTNPMPSSAPTAPPNKSNKPAKWRFCKLSGTKKTLHWADFPDQLDKKPLFDQLTERLDLSSVIDVVTGLASPIHKVASITPSMSNSPSLTMLQQIATSSSSGVLTLNPPPAPIPPPPMLGGPSTIGTPITSPSHYANSTLRVKRANHAQDVSYDLCFSLMTLDNISVLDLICVSKTQLSEWTDGLNLILCKPMVNKDSNEFVSSLTDIMSRLRVLDVYEDRLELLDKPHVPPLPPNVEFYYEDVANTGSNLSHLDSQQVKPPINVPTPNQAVQT